MNFKFIMSRANFVLGQLDRMFLQIALKWGLQVLEIAFQIFEIL